MLGPGTVGAGGMSGWCTHAAVVRRRAPLWAWRRCRPRPAHPLICATAGFLCPGCLGGGGFSVLSPPQSVFPHHSLTRGGHSGGFVPLGQLCHSGGVGALWQLDPPSHSLAGPPWVFRHSGGLAALLLVRYSGGLVGHSRGLAAPVVAPHSRKFSGRVFPPACKPHPFRRPCPMVAPRSRLVGGREGGFPGVAPAGYRFTQTPVHTAFLCSPCRRHPRFVVPSRPLQGCCIFICRRAV